jgi:hypothetical protein
MALARAAASHGRVAHGALEARSRRELLRLARQVVTVTAPRWRHDGVVSIVVRDPALTEGDIRSAFDEIHEKLHVDGVELRIDDRERRGLLAVFSRAQ